MGLAVHLDMIAWRGKKKKKGGGAHYWAFLPVIDSVGSGQEQLFTRNVQ